MRLKRAEIAAFRENMAALDRIIKQNSDKDKAEVLTIYYLRTYEEAPDRVRLWKLKQEFFDYTPELEWEGTMEEYNVRGRALR